jgi:Zn-finger nucleic acid-binding protein
MGNNEFGIHVGRCFAILYLVLVHFAKGRKGLRCPVCTEAMIVLEIEGIEIDHCTSCGGIWLDSGELELLLEGASNKDTLMASLTQQTGGREEERRCPICSKKLDKVLYGAEGKVMLDMCPRNDGLWFDGGELHDVLAVGDFPANHRVYELIKETFANSPG